MSEKKFRANFKDWRNITLKTADFYFKEAEKRLLETIETDKSITASTNKIITFILPLFILISGFLLKSLSELSSELNYYLILPSSCACIILIIALFKAVEILKPKSLMTTGSMPKNLISEKPIVTHGKTDDQFLDILLVQCENYQIKIDKNIETNTKRSNSLHSIYSLISRWLPASIIVSIILALILASCNNI